MEVKETKTIEFRDAKVSLFSPHIEEHEKNTVIFRINVLDVYYLSVHGTDILKCVTLTVVLFSKIIFKE